MENKIKEEAFTENIYYALFMEGIDCVYFVKDNLSNMIKIGYTSGLENRMKDVLTGASVCSDRKLLRVIHGTHTTENALHKKFEDIRWVNKNNKKREWFQINDELVDFVNSLETSFSKSQIASLTKKTKGIKKEAEDDILELFINEGITETMDHPDEIRYPIKSFHKAFRIWCRDFAQQRLYDKATTHKKMKDKRFKKKSSNGSYFYYKLKS